MADLPHVTTIAEIEQHVADRVAASFRALGASHARAIVQRPPRPDMGDFATPCFPLAKQLRRSPHEIAAQAAQAVPADWIIAEAYADGGFLNIRLNPGVVARTVVCDVLAADSTHRFASGHADESLRYLVEFSSPNTNKPLHLGHVRNNVLGLAICRMLEHAGHSVHKICLVNDRGVHICKTMLAYRRWGEATPDSTGTKGDHFVGALYVQFAARFAAEYEAWLGSAEGEAAFQGWSAEQSGRPSRAKRSGDPRERFAKAFEDEYFNAHSALGRDTRQLLRSWEAGEESVRELWRRMNEWVLAGFDVTYRRMGVAFDTVDYESDNYLLGRAIVEDGLAAGLFRALDDGAVVCDYDELGMGSVEAPHKVLLRGDGTTVYTTQDLGTALSRHDEIGFDRLVYVVADEQRHHFEVLFALLGLVRPALANACHHLSYGMVNLPTGRMKSREGTVVDADNLFDEMAALAAAELRQRAEGGRAHAVSGDDEAEIRRRAEVIAQAAIKFYLLAVTAESSMAFDPHKSIDFLGRTGPYCLNAYARTRQILAKAGGAPELEAETLERLISEREQAVVRALMALPGELRRAVADFDPSKVALATYEVARAFNQLYTDKVGHPIVGCDDPATRAARLHLSDAVGVAISTGLHLLGIEVLDQM